MLKSILKYMLLILGISITTALFLTLFVDPPLTHLIFQYLIIISLCLTPIILLIYFYNNLCRNEQDNYISEYNKRINWIDNKMISLCAGLVILGLIINASISFAIFANIYGSLCITKEGGIGGNISNIQDRGFKAQLGLGVAIGWVIILIISIIAILRLILWIKNIRR